MVIAMLRASFAPLIALCLLALPVLAQDLTEDQILERFEAQRDMYRASLQGQKTRGLDMVTIPSASTTASGAGATAATAGTVVFGEFAPDLQVNAAIHFAFDSASIMADQRPVLDKMCAVMRKSDIELFRIVGHTDAKGSDSYNENLSRLRADEVRRWLIDDCGIAATRLEAFGMGKRFLANPADPAGAENRRVEFQALS